MKSGDIKNILRRAKNRPPDVPGIYINLIRALVIILLGAAVGFSFYIKNVREQLADRAEELAKDRVKISVEAQALEDENARLKELIFYSDKLKIQGLKIVNREGELKIAGEIKNYGRQAVNDVELTAYFAEEDGTPLYEMKYIARSHDGRPLYRGQHRRFTFTVNPAPESASEVSVIITRIEF